MSSLKPNNQRARIAQILVVTVMAMDFLSLISGYFQYELLMAYQNGEYISEEYASANDTRELIVAILYGLAYFVSVFTFIRWFRRAYYNLHQKISYLSNDEGWAAGAWFIPIINFYKPFQIMKELYVETRGLLQKHDLLEKDSLKMGFVYLWWTLWISANILGNIEFRLLRKEDSITDYITSTEFGMLTSALGIILSLVTLKVMMDYAKAESLLFRIDQNQEGGEGTIEKS